tara:strand:- start:1056 stop:1253 length:198 start_codon:yes stop_codon:yes gene_type:complete
MVSSSSVKVLIKAYVCPKYANGTKKMFVIVKTIVSRIPIGKYTRLHKKVLKYIKYISGSGNRING